MRGALVLAALLLGALPVASAHVPLVGEGTRDIDADGSWVFYEELAPGATHEWTFHLARGERLTFLVSVPRADAWTPQASLTGPAGAIALTRVDEIGFEPFTPYAARDVWSLDARAPAEGEYTLRIAGEGGRYALGSGARESFTLAEWVTMPLAFVRIHQWEGQPAWSLALPYVAGLLVVGIRARQAIRRGPAVLLGRLASGLMIGTAVERAGQVAIAFAVGANVPAWALLVTLALLAITGALAVAAWRARRAAVLLLIGGIALLTWAGLLVGPALALLAGIEVLVEARRDRRAARPT